LFYVRQTLLIKPEKVIIGLVVVPSEFGSVDQESSPGTADDTAVTSPQ
jgi:hypothetical protein